MPRELLMMQNSFQWTDAEGLLITADKALSSNARNFKVEGQTYQDVFVNRPNSGANSDYTFEPDGVTLVFKGVNSNRHFDVKDKSSYMLKTGTYYTYVVNIIRNNNTEEVGLYFNTSYQNEISYFTASHIVNVPKGFTGTLKFLTETKTDFSSVTVADRSYLGTNGKTLDVDIKFNYYILEGNYTNTELPTSINGIESVAEKESKNLFKDEGWINKHLNYSDNTLRCSNNFRLQVELNADYTVNFETNNPNLQLVVNGFNADGNWFIAGFNSDWLNKNQMPYSFKITNPEVKSIGFMFRYKNDEPISPTSSDVLNSNITVTEVNKYPVRISQSHNETDGIVLPNGVTNTIENGVLVKNVGKYKITGNENWEYRNQNDNFYKLHVANILNPITRIDFQNSKSFLICNNIPVEYSVSEIKDNLYGLQSKGDGSGFIVSIPKSELTEFSVNSAKEWLKNKNATVWYELANPITEPLSLTEVNMPIPLRSLPSGVCDTVEGNKVIQRIGKYTITGTETYGLRFENDYMFVVHFSDILTETAFDDYNNSKTKMICDKALCRDCSNSTFVSNSLTIGGRLTNSKGFIVAIPKSLLTEYTVAKAKEYIQSLGGITVYYELATPIEHELNIPPISIAKGGNIITTTNNIKPNLRIKYKSKKI